MVPVGVKRIIDAIGIVTHDEKLYLPIVAKCKNADGMIPRPENLVLSNLRETVELVSNANTPLVWRQRFENNCPIPGAIWANHLLVNGDEIIPADYDEESYVINLSL